MHNNITKFIMQKYVTMVYALITVYVAVIIWIGYEFHRAPLLDDNENPIEEDEDNK